MSGGCDGGGRGSRRRRGWRGRRGGGRALAAAGDRVKSESDRLKGSNPNPTSAAPTRPQRWLTTSTANLTSIRAGRILPGRHSTRATGPPPPAAARRGTRAASWSNSDWSNHRWSNIAGHAMAVPTIASQSMTGHHTRQIMNGQILVKPRVVTPSLVEHV